jgi:hypothetical protein
LADWRQQLETMVAFFHRHPTRAQLSDLRSWQNPDALPPISGALTAWLPAAPEAPSPTPVASPNALLVWLATQRIAEHSRELALWAQAQALMPSLTEATVWGVAEASAAAVDALVEAGNQRAFATALDEERTTLAKQSSKLEAKLQAGDKTRATLRGRLGQMGAAKSAAERAREQAEARAQALQEEIAALQAQQANISSEQLEELRQENELLLEQMHSAQEELERYFLLAKEREEALANVQPVIDAHGPLHGEVEALRHRTIEMESALGAAHQALTEAQAARQHAEHERDGAWASRAELQGYTESLQQRVAELEGALHHRTTEVEQALHQRTGELENALNAAHQALNEAQAVRQHAEHERDSGWASRAELQGYTESLQQRVAELESALHAQQEEAQALRARDAGLSAEQVEELKQENELLLEQMHTAQEELEHYFLQFKQKEEELKQAAERLDKFRQRYPNHVEWGAAQVQADEQGGVSIHFTDLSVAGRDFDHLEMELHTGPQGALVTLAPAHAQMVEARLQHALALDPWAKAGSATRAQLANLSTSAWRVCKALPHAALQALAQPGMAEAWSTPLTDMAAALADLDECLRWDNVRLRNEQVNTDYEHLWLRLENASFQQRQWPRFEFRLAAANVRKGKFSGHVKYEFPEAADGAPPVFEQWFEESEDEHGPKFELRFDTRKGAMDVGAWENLSADDHLQMLGLLTNVSRMLEHLEADGRALRRPKADWETLNRAAAKVLLGHLGLTGAPA